MQRFRQIVIAALLLVLLFPWAGAEQEEKRIALTLDDGPSAATAMLLDGLAEREVRATFFLCGYRITEYPEAVRRMEAEGHELGVHGCTHAYFTTMPEKALLREIGETAGAILQLTGKLPTLLRPPGGIYNDRVLRICQSAQMPVILWSVDPCDWNRAEQDLTVRRVLKKARDGDVILLHDMTKTTAKNVLALVDALKERGFQFCTVSELAERRGVTLAPGKPYAKFPLG